MKPTWRLTAFVLAFALSAAHSGFSETIRIPGLPEFKLPDFFGTSNSDEPAEPPVPSGPPPDYQAGLAELAQILPFNAVEARYGSFTAAEPERSFYHGELGGEGNGWLVTMNGQEVFWRDAKTPVFIKSETFPTGEAGEFKPLDWRADLQKLNKSITSPSDRFGPDTFPIPLLHAAVLHVRGEYQLARSLAAAAFGPPPRYSSADPIETFVGLTLNAIANAHYALAVHQLKLDGKLAPFRDRLQSTLERFDGCFYLAEAVRELERNVTATITSKETPSPFQTYQFSDADNEALDRLSQTFWLIHPNPISEAKTSPITTLAARGIDAIPELQAMLSDHRLTSLIDPDPRSYSQAQDLQSLLAPPSQRELPERRRALAPRPLSVSDLAMKLARPLTQLGENQHDELTLEDVRRRLGELYTRYKGLRGEALTSAMLESKDSDLKVTALRSLMASSSPEKLAPILLRYVTSDPPSSAMLDLLGSYARRAPTDSAPTIEAFLAKATDAKALAQIIAPSQRGNPYGDSVEKRIEGLRKMIKPATPESVMKDLIAKPEDMMTTLQIGLAKVEPTAMAKAYMATLSAMQDSKQLEQLLNQLFGLKWLQTMESDASGPHHGDAFVKALVADRPAWEKLFTDTRRASGKTIGELAILILYILASENVDMQRLSPLFGGGESMNRWTHAAVQAYWSSAQPIPSLPDGSGLDEPQLQKLKTDLLQAEDVLSWMSALSLNEGLAVTILAEKDPAVAERLRPEVDRVGQVVIDLPETDSIKKLRALKGTLLTVEAAAEIISMARKGEISFLITRPETPSPITLIIQSVAAGESNDRDHFIFHRLDRQNLSEDTQQIDLDPNLASTSEIAEQIRPTLAPHFGSAATRFGIFTLLPRTPH